MVLEAHLDERLTPLFSPGHQRPFFCLSLSTLLDFPHPPLLQDCFISRKVRRRDGIMPILIVLVFLLWEGC